MKAMVSTEYGPPDVLEMTEVAEPIPGDDEVLLKAHAASVNPADWHFLRGDPYVARLQIGLRRPKYRVLGCDVAGRVEAVGRNVATLQAGDEVFGSPFMRGFGAFAERVRVPEELLVPKPVSLSFEQAAAVPLAASTALQGLRDHGRIRPGQRVLIVGASGGVGTYAVQIAKAFGARVTGVCSTTKARMVRAIGADRVVDYTQEDFAEGGRRYDLILDIGGNSSLTRLRRALTPRGTLVIVGGEGGGRWLGGTDRQIRALLLSRFVGQKLGTFINKENHEDMLVLKDLVESGKVTPVIDRTYPLSEVPEAIRYLGEGHAQGKVVITV